MRAWATNPCAASSSGGSGPAGGGDRAGRLVRVSARVSRHLEITEIHTRLLAERGPAVLFENVADSSMPVLTNLFGTVERVAWGMSREPHELRELGKLLAFFKQ